MTDKKKKSSLRNDKLIRIARLNAEVVTLRKENKLLTDLVEKQDQEITTLLSLDKKLEAASVSKLDMSDVQPLRYNERIPIAVLSDIHGEEIVDPKKVLGLNTYNPDIAEERIKRYFALILDRINKLRREGPIKRMHLILGGDNTSSNIHDELKETNALLPINASFFVETLLMKGIMLLAENAGLEELYVICVTGNHPRITHRTTFKTRAGNSLEYYSYKNLERIFTQVLTGYNNVKFHVAEGAFALISNIFGKSYTASHGDHFNYQGGVGGIMIPATRWHLQFSKAIPADKRFIGNWHQWMPGQELSINGSVVGYNEFAMGKGFGFQPALQHLEILDAQYGFTDKIPIILQ